MGSFGAKNAPQDDRGFEIAGIVAWFGGECIVRIP